MTDNSDLKFSEIENIEINRRSDEVNALITSGARLMAMAIELDSEITERIKSLKSYWYWTFGLIGIVIDLILRKQLSGLEFNIGTLILLLTFGSNLIGQINKAELLKKLSALMDKLHDLERHWAAATGAKTFWELKRFIEDGDLDNLSDEFNSWRIDQRYNILERVCDYDRAKNFIQHERKLRKELTNFNID